MPGNSWSRSASSPWPVGHRSWRPTPKRAGSTTEPSGGRATTLGSRPGRTDLMADGGGVTHRGRTI